MGGRAQWVVQTITRGHHGKRRGVSREPTQDTLLSSRQSVGERKVRGIKVVLRVVDRSRGKIIGKILGAKLASTTDAPS